MNERLRQGLAEAEEGLLSAVVSLLRARVPLSSWPTRERDALARALANADTDPSQWQTVALRRHLLGASPVPPELAPRQDETADVLWAADRLRADLAGLVPFRALRRL